MEQLAAEQPGYLGFCSVREGKLGLTLSYWRTEQALVQWKQVAEHAVAQTLGQERWYEHYRVEVAKVERAYSFDRTA